MQSKALPPGKDLTSTARILPATETWILFT